MSARSSASTPQTAISPARSRRASSSRLSSSACIAGSSRFCSASCTARHSARLRQNIPTGSKRCIRRADRRHHARPRSPCAAASRASSTGSRPAASTSARIWAAISRSRGSLEGQPGLLAQMLAQRLAAAPPGRRRRTASSPKSARPPLAVGRFVAAAAVVDIARPVGIERRRRLGRQGVRDRRGMAVGAFGDRGRRIDPVAVVRPGRHAARRAPAAGCAPAPPRRRRSPRGWRTAAA